ncbi:MAG: hypothetical protein F6K55_18890 [Moorea sp. SIO4A3]|nr:hypothetical protein [Moorena sp. SIO4A3]
MPTLGHYATQAMAQSKHLAVSFRACLVGKWSWVPDEIAFRFSICPPNPLRMRSHCQQL